MMNNDFEEEKVRKKIKELIERFERDKHYYLSKDYAEPQARIDFIDPLFESIGWDMGNKKGLPPHEREVLVERGETKGRPDYSFRIDGKTKFFVEAKAPAVPLDKSTHILQAKQYAWNTKEVFFVVLTDFERLKLYDASIKPNPRNPDQGLIMDLKYTEYLDKIDDLLKLSQKQVAAGELDELLLKDAVSKRHRIPVDKAFLEDMGKWREMLAKDIYKRNPGISAKDLNEVVQHLLDRLVFLRIMEDRKIIDYKSLLEEVEIWRDEGRRRDLRDGLIYKFRQVYKDFDGEIFKPQDISERYDVGSEVLEGIIDGLYIPQCPYRFDVIGVELLGSIYERYLGKTIHLTPQRVKVEDKPEVRKAGGVYYTPKFIVGYIVENTVGKLIEGKTPEEIAKLKILDPACGSGSFLLGAYQKLIDYHIHYYIDHPDEAGSGKLFPTLIKESENNYRLSIEKKSEILKNNIYGVDIDPQAVEITMMSLYIKALEGERTLPHNKELLPSLTNNVKCGNSLIGYEIFEQKKLVEEDDRSRINAFDWYSKSTGFGEIMENGGFDAIIGNPPYGADLTKEERTHLEKKFKIGSTDTAQLMMKLAYDLSSDRGFNGFIIPKAFSFASNWRKLREYLLDDLTLLVDVGKVWKEVKLEQIVYVVQKSSGKESYLSGKRKEHILTTNVKISKKECSQFGFLINGLDEEELKLGRKIYSNSSFMKDLVLNQRGAMLQKFVKGKGEIKVLGGAQIQRWFIRGIKGHITKEDITDDKAFIKDNSILVQNIIAHIQHPKDHIKIISTIYRDKKSIILDTINQLEPVKGIAPEYVLCILNSKLMNWYVYRFLFAKAIRTMHFDSSTTDRIPVPKISQQKQKPFIDLANHMLNLNKKVHDIAPSSERDRTEREIKVTDEKIDHLVYELYGLIDEEIKTVEESLK